MSDLALDEKVKGKIVSCPQFKKTIQANLT